MKWAIARKALIVDTNSSARMNLTKSLSRLGFKSENRYVLDKFPNEKRKEVNFIEADLLLRCEVSDTPDILAQEAQKLIKNGQKTPLIYKAVIKAFINANNETKANDYQKEADKLWPDLSSKLFSGVSV